VKPYHYHFRAYAKERMFGSTVLQVFLQEYRGRSEDYYVSDLITDVRFDTDNFNSGMQ
jgi:hypothetical protein